MPADWYALRRELEGGNAFLLERHAEPPGGRLMGPIYPCWYRYATVSIPLACKQSTRQSCTLAV